MTDQVYALGCELPLVKIGTSRNLQTRIEQCQQWSPLVLHLMWRQPGDREVEQRLHRIFADRRHHGEWFDFSGASVITLLDEAYSEAIKPVTLGARIRQQREALSLTQEQVARFAQCSSGVIERIEHNQQKPHTATLQKIAHRIGTTPEALTGEAS